MLATEKRDMLARPQEDMDEDEWLHGAPAADALQMKLRSWAPRKASRLFMLRYAELSRKPAPLCNCGGGPGDGTCPEHDG
jgi:hypothetical protein